MNKRGVALYLVLAVLLMVVILANIILSLVSSQSRLTQHKVKRIQAYYAAQAGVNYALEMLRLNTPGWATGAFPRRHFLCKDSSAAPCNGANVIVDGNLSSAIRYIEILIDDSSVPGQLNVTASVNYTSNN
mgnify:CR=1 FL=1